MRQHRAGRSFESLESRRVFSATPNLPPVADAGDDILIAAGMNVTLDGSHSSDPDNGPSPLTYEWSVLTYRAEYRLAYYLGPTPDFMSFKAGEYVLQLTVSDGVSQSSDTMSITVIGNASPPPEFPTQSILALGTVAGSKSRPLVKVVDARTGDVISKFSAYGSNFHGGVHVAVADLDGDGNAEIITAPGTGNSKSLIKVFDVHGVELPQFRTNAFAASFTGGVVIATGDVNGDGLADLIAAPASGHTAEIRVWLNRNDRNAGDPFTTSANRSFLAFDPRFKGSVTVAAGDLNGDGKAEVVVGGGVGMPPVVRGFDLTRFSNSATLRVPTPRVEIRPPVSLLNATGFSVAVGNFSNDPYAEIAVSTLGSGARTEIIYDYQGHLLRSFSPFGSESTSGAVYSTFKNVDDDEQFELVIAGRTQSGTLLTTWDSSGVRVDRVLEDDADFRDGAFIG